MTEFPNLTSLLEHLEKHASDYSGAYIISSLFETLYKTLAKGASNKNEIDQVLWEHKFFEIEFKDGTPADWCNRILADFDGNTHDYAATRLETTQNPILRARYAHVLWSGPKKDIDHAKIAIDSYLESAKVYEQKDRSKPNEWGLELVFATLNAYGLAVKTRHRADEVKMRMLHLIRDFNPQSQWLSRLRQDFLEIILKDSRKFDKQQLQGLPAICWKQAADLMKIGDNPRLNEARDILDIGQKIERKLNGKSYDWDDRRGQCYEKLMDVAVPGDPVIPNFCLNAIENYKKADRMGKVKELKAKYPQLAKSIHLGKVTILIDQTERVKRGRVLAEKLAKWSPEKIISFLVHQEDLLPRYSDIQKEVSTGDIEPILLDMVSTTIDDRGYPARHFCELDERLYRTILQEYGWRLRAGMPAIHIILEKVVGSRRLSAKTVLDFLREESWLGKELSVQSPAKGILRYRWTQLLEPSLAGYFNKLSDWIQDESRVPNLVLEIDSLTLKFEGMLRDLLRLAGVPTFRQTTDSKGGTITQEKDLAKLLYDEAAGSLFREDDLFFLKFLLVEKAAYNLRASVAHSLMLAEDYTVDYMHLLILTLLKLAKYDLANPSDMIASQSGRTFHRMDCQHVRHICAKNRIAFPNNKRAKENGYLPCRLCKAEHLESRQTGETPEKISQHVLVVRP